MDKGTIIYIGGFELPDKNAAAQRVITNGKLLHSLGYSLFYLGVDHTLNSDNYIEDTSLKNWDYKSWKVKYPKTIIEWINYLSDITIIKELIEKVLPENPEIIIAYNYPSYALAKLLKYCKLNKIILISDCTEWYEASGNILFRIIKNMDTILRMRWVHKKLNGIIAISRFLFDYYNNSVDNVLYLPPLVDLADEKWQCDKEVQSETRKLIYAGSPGSGGKDRLDKIINALSKLKDLNVNNFHLQVIGITEEQYLSDFNINDLPENFRDIVTFSGRISHGETIKAISNSDYFIFIRDNNRVTIAGFPTKFVESISCGVPVLTNDNSNIRDYLCEGKNGYILDTSSETSLVNSLAVALSQSGEKVADMKVNCISEQPFEYSKYKDQFQRFIDDIKLLNQSK
jgi:glycosyltransferase involved in cell wall biosynthesis